MALSPRPPAKPGTPHANNSVDRFADLAAHAGLLALSHELRGRNALALSDFAEVECRIAARHAALDRLSIELEYNRGALLDLAVAENLEVCA
ncbi:hypothetical protein [Methylobacterium persicinum]|uniref:Uncharacterized protein n=1 Tax=Methylobacterium persicinum TaxID=374426 RepID=A0ABU0HTK8_9HYPH|nr:hypothetical protein [Methylobacterium persicinum]MDQ0445257.1 hypothetical protein [Methylobacterium persicinum]GJE37878.1 hypothetical protein KHHGKMAE_1942 [Methylobacterium persicinum]